MYTQRSLIRLLICAVWSETLQDTVAMIPSSVCMRTAKTLIHRLILVLVRCTCNLVENAIAQLILRFGNGHCYTWYTSIHGMKKVILSLNLYKHYETEKTMFFNKKDIWWLNLGSSDTSVWLCFRWWKTQCSKMVYCLVASGGVIYLYWY